MVNYPYTFFTVLSVFNDEIQQRLARLNSLKSTCDGGLD